MSESLGSAGATCSLQRAAGDGASRSSTATSSGRRTTLYVDVWLDARHASGDATYSLASPRGQAAPIAARPLDRQPHAAACARGRARARPGSARAARSATACASASSSCERAARPRPRCTQSRDEPVVDGVLEPVGQRRVAGTSSRTSKRNVAGPSRAPPRARRGGRRPRGRGARARSSGDRARGRQRLDVLADVVDAEDRRAALVGGDGGADARRRRAGRRRPGRRAAGRASSCARTR